MQYMTLCLCTLHMRFMNFTKGHHAKKAHEAKLMRSAYVCY